MKIAIMQPYLFPYIGYFKLINLVDKFIIFDDVNFIKKGWINRNRILVNNNEKLFTLPLENSSQNRLIKDIKIFDPTNSKNSLLKNISSAYKKSPYFNEIYPMLEKIILNSDNNLSSYIKYSLQEICCYIGIDAKFLNSSSIDYDRSLKGQEKIIEIIKKLKAAYYYNLPNGIKLYDADFFTKNDITLIFVNNETLVYKQFAKNNFVPNLSIIDVLMFNSKQEIKDFLSKDNS